MVNVNMDGKTLFDGASPKTQSLEGVKALLTWKGRAVDPLPSVLEFTRDGEEGRLVLVLSNKKDSYYVVTARACSCPAASYHQGPCKHQRKYFGAKLEQVMAASEYLAYWRVGRPGRPEGKRPGGGLSLSILS